MKEENLKQQYRDLVNQLKEKGKQKGAKITNEFIADALSYDRSYFSSLLGERGNVTEKHIKDFMLHFPTKQEMELPKPDFQGQSLQNLSDSNKVLAEANKTLAEANKTLAEANHVISKNHDELIQLTKMIVSSTQLSKTHQGALGLETNVERPGFSKVTPSGSAARPGRSTGK
jgi:uncharacterized coiled-coil protein SlyX